MDAIRLQDTISRALGRAAAVAGIWFDAYRPAGITNPLASVTAIDDIPVPPPSTEAHIEALVARLGDHGLSAIATALKPADTVSDAGAHAKN